MNPPTPAAQVRTTHRRTRLVCLLAAAALSCGCQSWQKSHLAAIQSYSSGDLKSSQTELQKSLDSMRSEKEMLRLDKSILQLASGNPGGAEDNLREVRRELEHLEQTAVGEKATSLLTDDNAVAWAGRDYERHMVLNMLMLSSLLNNGTDSFAYSLQLAERSVKTRELIASKAATPPEGAPAPVAGNATPIQTAGYSNMSPAQSPLSQFALTPVDKPMALGSFLSATVQSEIPTRASDTDRALEELKFWNPRFAESFSQSESLPLGTRCQKGNGALHVIAMVGRAPEWVPESTVPTQASLLIADRILSITGKHTLPPTIAPVKIGRPMPNMPLIQPAGLRCEVLSANNEPLGTSLRFQTIADMNEAALASFEKNRDEEIARIVVRRIVKKGTVYVLKEAQKVSRNTAVDLAVNVAGIAWEAMEKPDTRSWHLLPGRVDVASSEVPAGTWNIDVRVGSGSKVTVPATIVDGRNTFVVFFVPETSITGEVLIGGADRATFATQ